MLGKTIIQSGAPDRMYHIMHDGITLVTAFFPIGRGEWTGKAQRSDDKYFKYFQHWARIHNDLVVYTTPENAERIRQIRLSFGRTNTQVYIVNDLDLCICSSEGETYLSNAFRVFGGRVYD